MPSPHLNARQSRFVAAYLKSGNATQAAIEAGYSVNTAAQIGSRLLRNVEVANAVVLSVADQGISLNQWVKEVSRLALSEKPSDDFTFDHKLKSLDLLGKHLGAVKEAAPTGLSFNIQINLGGNQNGSESAETA